MLIHVLFHFITAYLTPDELARVSPRKLSEYLHKYITEKPVKKSRMSRQVWLFPDESDDQTFQNIADRYDCK